MGQNVWCTLQGHLSTQINNLDLYRHRNIYGRVKERGTANGKIVRGTLDRINEWGIRFCYVFNNRAAARMKARPGAKEALAGP